MAAPKGNTYNEKWTEEKAENFFDNALAIIEEDDTILFIGTVANRLGTYRELFDYLIKKFPDRQDFRAIKKEIESVIESRTYEKALKGGVNSTMAIFGLKNNHGWRDRQEIDNTSSDGSMKPQTVVKIGRRKKNRTK